MRYLLLIGGGRESPTGAVKERMSKVPLSDVTYTAESTQKYLNTLTISSDCRIFSLPSAFVHRGDFAAHIDGGLDTGTMLHLREGGTIQVLRWRSMYMTASAIGST
jgi:hypothetical protein